MLLLDARGTPGRPGERASTPAAARQHGNAALAAEACTTKHAAQFITNFLPPSTFR
jgi:hypothetical protein